jgi:hypothetical protein
MTLFKYSSLEDPYLLIKCSASLQITESDLIKIVMLMFKAVIHGNFATFPHLESCITVKREHHEIVS